VSRPWKSSEWREFVRSLPCRCDDPRCPNCSPYTAKGGPVRVEAAHLRSQTGVGQKPPDFMCYPLSSAIHAIYHREGHPGVAWQLARVQEVLSAAFERGALQFDPDVASLIDF